MGDYYNTGRRINNGFIRNGHNVLSISDRDIIHNNKGFKRSIWKKIFKSKLLKLLIILNQI